MFSSPVSIRLSSGTSRMVAAAPCGIVDQGHADRDGGDPQRLRQQHGLDRIGQMIVQAGLGVAHILAEAQHDAEFFGLHPIEAGQSPDRHGAQQDQRDADAAEIAAGQQLLQPVLAAAQKVFKIGRPRPHRLRAGAPWPFRTRAPGASALNSSTASTVSFAGAGARTARPRNICRLYRGRPRPLQRRLLARSSYAGTIKVNANIAECS